MIVPADDAPLHKADKVTSRMDPLVEGPAKRRHPPMEPRAECRLCHTLATIHVDDKTLFVHRIRDDLREPFCPDRGTYAGDYAAWQMKQEEANRWP